MVSGGRVWHYPGGWLRPSSCLRAVFPSYLNNSSLSEKANLLSGRRLGLVSLCMIPAVGSSGSPIPPPWLFLLLGVLFTSSVTQPSLPGTLLDLALGWRMSAPQVLQVTGQPKFMRFHDRS